MTELDILKFLLTKTDSIGIMLFAVACVMLYRMGNNLSTVVKRIENSDAELQRKANADLAAEVTTLRNSLAKAWERIDRHRSSTDHTED